MTRISYGLQVDRLPVRPRKAITGVELHLIRLDGNITETSLREHHAVTMGVALKVAILRRSLLEV